MDDKRKWWDKLAKAGAKDKKDHDADASNAHAASNELEAETGDGAPPATRPGAVAVRGPEYQGSGFGDASTVQGAGGGNDQGTNEDEAPLQVDSYLVQEGPTDEEIRQRILAGTAHAEKVDNVDPIDPRRHSRKATVLLLAVVVAVVVAIAVGVAVPLSNGQQSFPIATQYNDDIVASLKYLEWQGSGGFAAGMNAETRNVAGSQITSGANEFILCRPSACTESDTSCLVGDYVYKPGCCAGADCPNQTKCGEHCPPPPESCYLTDPNNKTCIQSECYTCPQDNGKDVYRLRDYANAIDCLEVGTAIRPDNGLEYKWAIVCGPVILGPIVEENRDLGEYQCTAARLGATFSDDDGGGGLLAPTTPCQYIALAECGCGPPDMYTFGLPAPTGPCQPDSGCPFLCEGVGGGNDYARNLCRSFPGNISWWEGRNAFNASKFYENSMAPDYEFEIYIKGVLVE